ncbi:MAG TPA: biotin/lipoyl-containing protein, partial [Beijerinckiaceae bacterium]|nr:biotin/lipoyl-containing protein [Beijerinckiaceae bacterium]
SAARIDDVAGPWSSDDAFQLVGARETGLSLTVDGAPERVSLSWNTEGPSIETGRRASESAFTIVEADESVLVLRDGRQTRVALHDPFAVDLEHMDQGGLVKAPMHGKLIAVFVKPGDRVEKGQRLAILEAMKMEHVLSAPLDGEVVEVAAEAGAQVPEAATLIVIQAAG